jgi:molecular chaperone DnaK (HSP70)
LSLFPPAIGIDYGTTKSAIAVLESTGPRIINLQTSRPRRDVELAAQVFGALLTAAQKELASRPERAVIAVPTRFGQNDVHTTHQAARAAGLKRVLYLPKVIASALAHNFHQQEHRGQWMVFHAGAGGLDVSLVMIRDGELFVPEEGHAGHDDVGGLAFDRQLMTLVLRKLSRAHSVEQLARAEPRFRDAHEKLRLAVEASRIELSIHERALVRVDGVLCEDDYGKSIEVSVDIQRAEYEDLISGRVQHAVEICRRLLARNKLSAKNIQRLILTGGLTATPHLRNTLATRLGIPIETSVDPLTAVSAGASIHARARLFTDATGLVTTTQRRDSISLSLVYEPVSREATVPVAVKIESLEHTEGLRCETTRVEDGRIHEAKVTANNEVEVELKLITGARAQETRFSTRLYDARGEELVHLDGPHIWHGFPTTSTRLAASIRVALDDNKTQILVPAGASLPARASLRLAATNATHFPLLEGHRTLLGEEDDHADCCVRIGALVTSGGGPVDIEIEIDAARQIKILVCSTGTEEIFDSAPSGAPLEELDEKLASLYRRLSAIETIHKNRPRADVEVILQLLQTADSFALLDRELLEAKWGDKPAHLRADRRARELGGTINAIERLQTVDRARLRLESLSTLIEPETRRRYLELTTALDAVEGTVPSAEATRIEARIEELEIDLRDRYLEILRADFKILPAMIEGTSAQIWAARRAQELLIEVGRLISENQPVAPAKLLELRIAHRTLSDLFPQLVTE